MTVILWSRMDLLSLIYCGDWLTDRFWHNENQKHRIQNMIVIVNATSSMMWGVQPCKYQMLWPKSSRFDQGRYLNRIPCRRTLRAMNLADLDRETGLQGNSDVRPNLPFFRTLPNVNLSQLWGLFTCNLYKLCPAPTVLSAPPWSTLNCTFCGKSLGVTVAGFDPIIPPPFITVNRQCSKLLFHFPI